MDRSLLLITATALEAKPLTEGLIWEQVDFPLGELYRVSPQPPAPTSQIPLFLAHLGVAKVNTAAGLALLLRELQPEAVIQFGIGGAFVSSFLSIGMLAVATQEIHLDTGVKTKDGWQGMEVLGFPLHSSHLFSEAPKRQGGLPVTRRSRPPRPSLFNVFPTNANLTEFIAGASGAHPCVFGTSETITGDFDDANILQERFDLSLESMEGAAAAQVCTAFATPFAELRAVSNIVGERDKRAWNIPLAVRVVNRAVLELLRSYSADYSARQS